MDTSYLAQQVNNSIVQLHGLFDEIGVPSHEREARESEVGSPRVLIRRIIVSRLTQMAWTALRGSVGGTKQPSTAGHVGEEGARRGGKEDHHLHQTDGSISR